MIGVTARTDVTSGVPLNGFQLSSTGYTYLDLHPLCQKSHLIAMDVRKVLEVVRNVQGSLRNRNLNQSHRSSTAHPNQNFEQFSRDLFVKIGHIQPEILTQPISVSGKQSLIANNLLRI
jgi:hypothetical protein